ncbi:MAG TPA: nuclear transport factor 2 family protein [Caulobacteraceae bacterium]|nr:nuclear transport factor 2 family protein [Caulobacteraceae bacterium]
MLTALDRMLAEHECAKLAIAYGSCVDGRDIEGFMALWSEDAVWYNTRGPLEGAAAIRRDVEATWGKSPPGRHICTNISVKLADDTHASGTSYFMFYLGGDVAGRPATIPQFIGRYLDDYVKTETGWRIASRRIELALKLA